MDNQSEADIRAEFLSVGWRYLTAISGEGFCNDRSCLRCRIADILFEVESRSLIPDSREQGEEETENTKSSGG